MPGKFHHESLYRGPETLAKLARLRVVICGVGAVGSNLADNLVRQGLSDVRAIDHDRVDEHNVSTQAYGESDVGISREVDKATGGRIAGAVVGGVRRTSPAAE